MLYAKIYDIVFYWLNKMSKEGKLHLVESCSFPNTSYKNVTKDSKYTNLVESAKKLSTKSKLSEATLINKVKKTLNEAKIDEKMQKQVLENLQEAGANVDEVEIWQFPISKVNDKEHPNLNGRVYGKKLWENVINNQADVWKGGTGLANHPADDEDGDFMKQSIVWLDGFIGDDDIVYGIGTFVGEGGELARQIIGVGGRIGFSSSGYGDFLSDKMTVDPDSYEIDRFADLVLNPSQGVFGDHNDAITYNVAESAKNNKDNNLKENVNNMKKALKESVDLKSVVDAVKADDSVEQLSKIADSNNIKLNEGAAEETSADLAAELTANVFKDIKADEVTADQIKDVKEIVDTYKENDAEVENKFKDVFKNAGVADDTISTIFKDEVEEDTEDSEDEDLEEDEDLSLEEQLLVKHYSTQLKNIGKESEELWEEKIQKLNSLVDKLRETKLSNKAKSKLNTQTQNMIEAIMKDARLAIQEGFKAKEICEELGISSISKLSNIKEKLEDFTSLEECLEKTTKEANKYKNLYESKKSYALSEARSAYLSEEKVNKLNNKIKTLKENLDESSNKNAKLNRTLLSSKVNNTTLQEKYNRVLADKRDIKIQLEKVSNRNNSLRETLVESNKTINSLKRANTDLQQTLAEKDDTIEMLKKQLREAKANTINLRNSQRKLSNENRKISENLETLKREDRLQRAKKTIKENAIRQEKAKKENEFYDTDLMFKDSDNIQNFIESVDAENKNKYKNVKTLREAEDKYLFSNELLDSEAEEERAQIRAPEDTPSSLADLFN